MTGRLQGKVALITGGTSGIGEATARLFAREGAQVAITGRRRELGEAVIARIKQAGGEAIFIAADVTRVEDCRRSIDETIAAYGRIDILFNNAGIVTQGTLEETSEDDWVRTFDVNVKGTYLMTKLVLPIMRALGRRCHRQQCVGLGHRGWAALHGVQREQGRNRAADEECGAGSGARSHPRECGVSRRHGCRTVACR